MGLQGGNQKRLRLEQPVQLQVLVLINILYLINIHVGLSAAAGLVYNERELVGVFAFDHQIRRLLNCPTYL